MSKHTKIPPAQTIDEAADERRMSAWRKLARALVKALRQVWAAIFGGTVDDVKGDIAGGKRIAGKAANVAGTALVGAGHGLDAGLKITHGAASTVGRILGALLPSQPVGPRDVAESAVANDNMRRALASLRATIEESETATDPAVIARLAIEGATVLATRGQDAGSRAMSKKLPSEVSVWLLRLHPSSLRTVMGSTPDAVEAHIAGTRPIDGVMPVEAFGFEPVRVIDDAEIKARARAARQSLAASKGEAELASRRGTPHRVVEPIYAEEPSPFPARRRVGPGFY